jgi:enolase-phosphatase E1
LTAALLNPRVRVILCDVEGTTTPLDFVHKVLFPYARAHIALFLKQNNSVSDVHRDLEALREEHRADVTQGLHPPPLSPHTHPSELQSGVSYIIWLMDQDRKSTALKSLQGKIWEEGYRNGDLRSQVFADVPPFLKRWHDQKRRTGIFSSGSILAQKLLFAHTTDGDLTPLISAYFDTTTGPKRDPASYQKIAGILETSPSAIVFISDITAELDAAASSGFETLLCVRPGNHPQPSSAHAVICSFDELSV